MGYKRLEFKSIGEWLGGRIIGGSGASAIIGESPYYTNVEYYKELLKRKKAHIVYEDSGDDKAEENKAIWFGKNAEQYIREIYRLKNIDKYEVIAPKTIEKDGVVEMLISDEQPFMTATLDSELIEKETNRKGILEIKTANTLSIVAKQKWRDTVPSNYLIQVLHYMLVKDNSELIKKGLRS